MKNLYESILAGRKSSINNNVATASLDVLHDHTQGIGKDIKFVDNGEIPTVEDGVVSFIGDNIPTSVNFYNAVNMREVMKNSGIKAARVVIDLRESYNIQECIGDITCQNLAIEADGDLVGTHIKFKQFSGTYMDSRDWKASNRNSLHNAGNIYLSGTRTNSKQRTVFKDFDIDNSEGRIKVLMFHSCCPELVNFKAVGYDHIRIYDALRAFDEDAATGSAIGSLLDKSYTFKYNEKGVSTTRSCKMLKKIVAFFNNPKRYNIIEPAYRIKEDAKISDIWDLSGISGLEWIEIEDNNVMVSITKDRRRAESFLPLYDKTKFDMNDMLENYYKTADDWYVIFRKRYF